MVATNQDGTGAQEPAKAPEEASKPAETPASDPAPAADKPAEAMPASQEITEEEWKERLEAARERITKENTRKIEQRDEKLNAARAKVNELNRRFADWYYVIGEGDYDRLRVAFKDLIQPKSASAGPGNSGLPGGVSLPGLPIQP